MLCVFSSRAWVLTTKYVLVSAFSLQLLPLYTTRDTLLLSQSLAFL